MIKSLAAAVAAVSLASSTAAISQSWSAEQSEVWNFISSSWERHADAGTWHQLLDPAGYGWNNDYPVPTGQATMGRRAAVFGPEGKVLFHRVDPLAITVSGDTAIAYYYANVVETNHAGKRETSIERCADTLTRRSGQWRFLGWHCITKTAD